MSERDNRPTTPQPSSRVAKAAPVAGWTALVAVIPAIIMAWQSGNAADSAKSSAKEHAHDVSEKGYERDTRFLRRTKRVNDHQDEEIDECFARLNDVSEALEELYDHVNDEDAHKASRRTSRPMSEAAKPDWTRPPRYLKPHGEQVQMPASLEDL